MKTQLKNSLLSKTSDVLSRMGIKTIYLVYDRNTILVFVNDKSFKVDNQTTPTQIKESAEKCLAD